MEQKERIELHCHTKNGGNATLYEGEAILYASMRNMPAIAVTDRSSILAFPKIESVVKQGEYSARPIYGMEMLVKQGRESKIHAITVLVMNETGKENLYAIVSESRNTAESTAKNAAGDTAERKAKDAAGNTEERKAKDAAGNMEESTAEDAAGIPVYEKEALMKRREGLLLGSGGEMGELRLMAKEGADDDALRKVMEELDYVEILPLEEDKELNLRLIRLCEEANLPVVAVSAPYFLEEEDGTAWEVLRHTDNLMEDVHGLHLFTTEEMLEAFSYLPKEKASKIVVDNTHEIAKCCQSITICPKEKIYPRLENAWVRLWDLCMDELVQKYDEAVRETAKERLDWEMKALGNTGMESIMLLLREFMEKAGLRACDVSCRGCSAGSIVAYLLGISEVDPIKHHLEPEIIFGFHQDRMIDVDLNVPYELQEKYQEFLGDLEGIGRAIHAGVHHETTIPEAQRMLSRYEEDTGRHFDEDERDRICGKIVGNLGCPGRHPTGMLLIPKGCDYRRIIPVTILPDGCETSYFDYYYMDYTFVKQDILGIHGLDALHELARRMGIDLSEVPTDFEGVRELFLPDENGEVTGCADLPEFKSPIIREMIATLQPQNFDDLVKICSLFHGTNTWIDNAQILVETQDIGISELIAARDDLFTYLLSYGLDREKAYRITDAVRKGMFYRRRTTYLRGKWQEWKAEMLEAGIPKWIPWSCERVQYLFPKAHVISYVIVNMRMAWFKMHDPDVYETVIKEYNI